MKKVPTTRLRVRFARGGFTAPHRRRSRMNMKSEPRRILRAASLVCAVLGALFVVIFQGGCATRHTIEHFGIVDEHFYGTGPVHQVGNDILVQGITLVAPKKGPLREHPSYVVLTIGSHRAVSTEWIDPGQLPEATLAHPVVPYQQGSLRGASERTADFHASGSRAKYYGGNWLLIQNPDNPETHIQVAVEPSRRYRSKTSYPAYVFVFAGSVALDVVTSPFQIIGYFVLNKLYENWH